MSGLTDDQRERLKAITTGTSENGAGPDADTKRPFALPLDEFIATKSEMPSVLIGDEQENLLPAGGLLILFAKGGRGKTTLTNEGAFHFASGRDWLGFKVPRPLRVLIIENEGPREPFRVKLAMRRQLWKHEIPGEIYIYVEDWGSLLLGADSILRLRRFIEEHQVDLVIGDPLDSLGIKGVGSPEDTREFVKLLVAAGLTRDVAFWLLHHPRKADADEELDEISGAWGGRVDTLLKLDKLDGNRARLSFPKIRWGRAGKRPALILGFDPETEEFTVAHEEQKEEERDHAAEISALLADGNWRTVGEIAAPRKAESPGIGTKEATVKRILEGQTDMFESRTGTAAKVLGRHSNATIWRLRRPSVGVVGDAQETLAIGDVSTTSPSPPALLGGDVVEDVPDASDEPATTPRRRHAVCEPSDGPEETIEMFQGTRRGGGR